MVGTIINVKLDKGFGFIRVPNEPKDFFFHMSALEALQFDRTLEQRRVEFEAVETDRGREARSIKASV
jgi:cold shock CspA family protein